VRLFISGGSRTMLVGEQQNLVLRQHEKTLFFVPFLALLTHGL
jgi:hypothetical protein